MHGCAACPGLMRHWARTPRPPTCCPSQRWLPTRSGSMSNPRDGTKSLLPHTTPSCAPDMSRKLEATCIGQQSAMDTKSGVTHIEQEGRYELREAAASRPWTVRGCVWGARCGSGPTCIRCGAEREWGAPTHMASQRLTRPSPKRDGSASVWMRFKKTFPGPGLRLGEHVLQCNKPNCNNAVSHIQPPHLTKHVNIALGAGARARLVILVTLVLPVEDV
eukprot:359517-Chlamydomonas_euryale.AAC.18